MAVPGDELGPVLDQLLDEERTAQGLPPPEHRLVEEAVTRLERRVAELEREIVEFRNPKPSADGLAWLLLTVGQVVSVVACIGSLISGLFWLLASIGSTDSGKSPFPDSGPNPWILFLEIVGFVYCAAMYVVFTLVKKLPAS